MLGGMNRQQKRKVKQMSKKHFIALADAIREHNARNQEPFTDKQIMALADFCETQNPMFKRERWQDYIAGTCGPNGGIR